MSRWLPVTVGLALLGAAHFLRAQNADPITSALAQPVLAPGQALDDIERYCESRVPGMPPVTSRDEWRRYADRSRRQTLDKVVFRGEAAHWREAPTHVEWLETIDGGPGYHIRKLRYEVLPGLWAPALLYQPDQISGKAPVVLNVNGHDADGKAASYKQIRCINQAKRGMLALNLEWFGMGQLRTPGFQHGLINALDLTGTSGIATHYLAMKRGLDVLLSLEHADTSRVAVTGLSGGGWQTIFISGLDRRVTLSNPVAGYSSFRTRIRNHSDLGDSEQTPCDLATVVDYAQLTAMRAPNPTLLTFNAQDDCCFRADHALQPLLDAAGPIYKLYGQEANLRSHVNEVPGTHNYLRDNREAFYRMAGDHFFTAQPFDATEISSDGEVKTKEQLQVPLPERNADFASLALSISRDLPREGGLPTESGKALAWQRRRRTQLRAVLKAHDYAVLASTSDTRSLNGLAVTHWRLRMGDEWTIPAVEFARSGAKDTVLVVADGGRASAAQIVSEQLNAGRRVVAVDPLFLGEAQPQPERQAYLWALLLGAVGERPLGIEASQLRSVARWLNSERKTGPVTLSATGQRACVAALAAAGLEEAAIGSLELRGSLGSLKEPLEQKVLFQSAPELFCFGLLESFDIPQLAALSAPRPVRFVDAGARVKKELAPLEGWYRTFGVPYQPLR